MAEGEALVASLLFYTILHKWQFLHFNLPLRISLFYYKSPLLPGITGNSDSYAIASRTAVYNTKRGIFCSDVYVILG